MVDFKLFISIFFSFFYSILGQAQNHSLRSLSTTEVARPVAEFEPMKYLFLNGSVAFGSQEVKQSLLRHLPAGVHPIIYVESDLDLEAARRRFHAAASNRYVEFVTIEGESGTGFWSRDTFPVPVRLKDSRGLGLVDFLSPVSFEPDFQVASRMNTRRLSFNSYFRGGNLITDSEGQCFTVRTRFTQTIPDFIFRSLFGCQKITRLPYVTGSGSINERVKFLSANEVVTDISLYHRILESEGYSAKLLPRPHTPHGSYINALLINNTLFVPTYDEYFDETVIVEFERHGLTVIPLASQQLSEEGMGGIQSMTMTYPEFE